MKHKFKAAIFLVLVITAATWYGREAIAKNKAEDIKNIISEVSTRVLRDEDASGFSFKNKKVQAQFHFNKELEDYIKKQMRSYTSKAMAVVVMDNDTGKVISLLSYDKKEKQFGRSMALIASHPSASLSKIISAADLIENAGYNPWTNIQTRGRGTTLYKYQLKKELKWSRRITLAKAFAYSNNAAIGKAVIQNSSALSLYKMAMSFGFNKSISNHLKLPKSVFQMPKNQYNLAELASGFNTETMISPLHAALFASIVANDGVLKKPKLLKSLTYKGETIIEDENSSDDEEKVLSYETATTLSQLMTKTVEYGTARKSFRRLRRKLKRLLEIGGKTGSITGGIPEGKRDWFAAYSRPKDKSDRGISVSVMCIQGEKWRAKSSYLAKTIIEYYYKRIKKLETPSNRVFARK